MDIVNCGGHKKINSLISNGNNNSNEYKSYLAAPLSIFGIS